MLARACCWIECEIFSSEEEGAYSFFAKHLKEKESIGALGCSCHECIYVIKVYAIPNC